MYGWRFYPEPKAWTCFFEYPEQTFGFFFILFFVKMFTPNFLVNWGYKGCSIGSGEQGCGFLFFARRPRLGTVWQYGFVKMRKKKNTLLWWFDFWGCFESVQYSVFSVQWSAWTGNGKHLQKTMKITLAVAFLLFFGWVRLGADILHNNPYNFQGDCVGCWEWIIRFIM